MVLYTNDGVPVISKSTYESTLSLLDRAAKGKKSSWDEVAGILRKENPEIFKMLEQLLSYYGESEYVDGASFGAYMTYELIRRQIVANKMRGSI